MNKHTLRDFISHVKYVGLPTASHFYIEIGDLDRSIWMLCDQANIPGINIMTSEKRTYGEIRETPYGVTYQPLQLSVLLDNNGLGKREFDNWANKVYNRRTRALGYYNDYVREIRLYLMDKNSSKVVYAVKFNECYPKSISDAQLDYASHDIIKINVSIAFKSWEEIDTNINAASIAAGTNYIPNYATVDSTVPAGIPGADNYGIGPTLQKYGFQVGTNTGSISTQLGREFGVSGITGGSTLNTTFGSIGASMGQLGSGIASLGQNLTNVMGPISAMRGAVGSVASGLGTVNSVLQVLGLGTPFTKSIGQLTKVSGQLGTLAGLKGLPQVIGSVGSSMGGIATTVGTVQKSIDGIPGTTKALSKTWDQFGKVFNTESNTVTQAAAELNNYTDTLYG